MNTSLSFKPILKGNVDVYHHAQDTIGTNSTRVGWIDIRHPNDLPLLLFQRPYKTAICVEAIHVEMFGSIPDDGDTKFCKRSVNVHDIDKINKQLSDQGEQHMGVDEKLVTADGIDIYVPGER